MTVHLSLSTTMMLMTLTAIGYSVATVGMKMASDQISSTAVALMAFGLICAAASEITLLREANLAIIYLGIIAFETLLVLCFAALIGDTLNLQQMAGAVLVLLGMALVAH